MLYPTQFEAINNVLGVIPDTLFHGRYAIPTTKEKIKNELKIFETSKDLEGMNTLERLKYGRNNLDCAFHGFYLTPSLGHAVQWALSKPLKEGKEYQIIKFKRIKNVTDLKIKINIVPDSQWAEHIILNRGKFIDYNPYDLVYNYIADGGMTDISNEIKNNSNYKIEEIHKKLLENQSEFLDIFYNKSKYSKLDIIDSLKLQDYRHYQLCISSNNALKYFDIDDIIILTNKEIEENNFNNKNDLIEYINKNYGYNKLDKSILKKLR